MAQLWIGHQIPTIRGSRVIHNIKCFSSAVFLLLYILRLSMESLTSYVNVIVQRTFFLYICSVRMFESWLKQKTTHWWFHFTRDWHGFESLNPFRISKSAYAESNILLLWGQPLCFQTPECKNPVILSFLAGCIIVIFFQSITILLKNKTSVMLLPEAISPSW